MFTSLWRDLVHAGQTMRGPGTMAGVVLTIVLNRLNAENMGISRSPAEPLPMSSDR